MNGDGGETPSMRKKISFDCAVYQSVRSVVAHQSFSFRGTRETRGVAR